MSYLQEKVNTIEKDLIVECEENQINPDESCHYHLRIDEYGCPYGHGNSDDCYSDGYDMGEKDGELQTLKLIIDYIKQGVRYV